MALSDATDEGLLVAIREGDRGALGELYDRHAPWLLLRLRRRGADGELAEEVIQDTFLAVWRKPHAYAGRGPVAAWIWGIGIRRLIDRLRRSRSLRPLPRGRDAIVVSAEDEVMLAVEFGDLAGALSRLSPELRAVVQADRARWTYDQGSSAPAPYPSWDGQDPDDARPRSAERGAHVTWHVPIEVLRGYGSDRIDSTQQLSIEAHLTSCSSCRSNLAALVDNGVLERTWSAIAGEIAAPQPGTIERLLLVLGITDHSARLVAATPSLRRSWLLAVAAVLSLGVFVANGAAAGYVLFLAVAPMLPLAGIAAAYGPGIDPTYEIGIAAPMSSFRLLLIRAMAVLISTVALGGIAALFLPALDWRAAAWLLPSLALAATCLALSTMLQPLRAAVIVGGAWLAIVAAAAWSVPTEVAVRSVFGAELQVAVVIVGIGAGLVLVARREELETGEHR